MFRSRLGLLGLCAMVLGVMAISASGAQAAGSWLVGTTEITNTSSLPAELTGEIDTPEPRLLAHLVGLTVTIICKEFTTSGFSLKGEGRLSEGGIVHFTGCVVQIKDSKGEKSGACAVKSLGASEGLIGSEELKGELVLHELTGGAKDVLARIEPKMAGGAWVTLHFYGPECLLPLMGKLTGAFFVKDCQGFAETLKIRHLVEQAPLTSLSFGVDTVEHLETSIDGSFWVGLAGVDAGREWRGMGV